MRRELSIKSKIMAVVMLTSMTVLALTVAAFMISDLLTFSEFTGRDLLVLARTVADNSGTALTFRSEAQASDILAALKAEPQIVSAALYGSDGKLFVHYPPDMPVTNFPSSLRPEGLRTERGQLFVVTSVTHGGTRVGMLYLHGNEHLLYERLRFYTILSAGIVLASVIVVLALANRLQKRISAPIIALAQTARSISEQRDFSVRAQQDRGDELGLLTQAFNAMLTRVEEQTVALQNSEARLRLALSASRTGTWDWNLHTGQLKWDDSNTRLFGLNPGEFDGTYDGFLRLVYPDDRRGVKEAVAHSLEHNEELSKEFRVAWPDGTIRDLYVRGRAFYDPIGKPARMSGISQDVTEHNRSEQASRYLASIVQSSDDAIISKDLNGIITSWNGGAEQLFGFTAAEAIGKPILLIIPKDHFGEEEFIIGRIRHGKRIDHYQTVRQRKDGTLIHVSLTVSPIRGEGGRVVGASKIARDIGDIRRAQEALESQARILREQAQMLDLANVMARDLDDRIILWNTGMEKMYGWVRTETLGRVSHEILKTESAIPVDQIRAILLREGRWEGELVHTRKDGRRITVTSQWVLHTDDRGNPAAILEVNTDITERELAEQEVLRVNADLERRVQERTAQLTTANNELEAFTYSVAHDLRAPLRHIDAFSRILIEDFSAALSPEGRRYLDIIRKGSQNMSQLVDDLLNLARVGRQELRNQIVSLNPLVREVITDLTREAGTRDIEWRVEPLPSIHGDPGLVKQVFANLLSNAVKYTRPRTKALIEIGQHSTNGQTVIYVRDNGVGFNMKYADKLFGVFQRLHRADEFEGTGVGLAIVDRVIRRHGGRIWAESTIGQGATFYFTLDGMDKKNNSG